MESTRNGLYIHFNIEKMPKNNNKNQYVVKNFAIKKFQSNSSYFFRFNFEM